MFKKLSGILISLFLAYFSFPNQLVQLDFLAWFCFVPLLLVIEQEGRGRKLFLLWSFFLVLLLALLWLDPFKFPEGLANKGAGLGLLSLYLVYPLGYSCLLTLYKRPLIAASAWIAFEYLLTVLPLGFPLSFAVTQYKAHLLLPICSITGIYGLSFLLIFTNCTLANFIRNRNKQELILPAIL
ncbi:MAG: hypothetical protein WC838_05980, partial [Candidatus Margulisiibacteriota bacterium]